MKIEAAIEAFGDFLATKQDELGEAIAASRESPKRLSVGWALYYQSRAYLDR
ncbi:hypothetical protein [Asticcacaulis sp. MM231]|uniref:hypothetical protein n=1 Tax=Asticcacaulis sp. MM231 TaxID=3157666 RepID=UPI0032D5810A